MKPLWRSLILAVFVILQCSSAPFPEEEAASPAEEAAPPPPAAEEAASPAEEVAPPPPAAEEAASPAEEVAPPPPTAEEAASPAEEAAPPPPAAEEAASPAEEAAPPPPAAEEAASPAAEDAAPPPPAAEGVTTAPEASGPVTIPPCAHEVCPQEVRDKGPQCGADGHTYVTECDRMCWGKGVEKASDGVCKEDAYHPEVLCLNGKCPEDVEARQSGDQECGEDGVTYANECERFCYGNDVPKKNDGPCAE